MSNNSFEKYKMFKNFMYNELGITKDDIQYWIQESIKEEVKKVIDKRMSENDKFDLDLEIDRVIKDEIYRTILHPEKIYCSKKQAFQDIIRKEIAKIIAEYIKIEIINKEGMI